LNKTHSTIWSKAYSLQDLFEIVQDFPSATLNGTGIFLTCFSDRAPFALGNNIKAHRVLHRNTVLLETHVAPSPRVDPAQRLLVKEVSPGFWQIQVRFGF
jgi:KUP system potassium uptake protein